MTLSGLQIEGKVKSVPLRTVPLIISCIIRDIKEIKMNNNIQKLKKEIFDSMKNNVEEKDVEAIIERSVTMTLKYVDSQVSTQKFFKDN